MASATARGSLPPIPAQWSYLTHDGQQGVCLVWQNSSKEGSCEFIFTLAKHPLIFAILTALSNRASVATCGPLMPIPVQWACLPHHGQCCVCLICWNLSQGGSSTILSTVAKNKGNYHKNMWLSDGLLTLPVALWHPFCHVEPTCYIMGDAGCARFVEIWVRGGVLWYFSSVAKNKGNNHKICNNYWNTSWSLQGKIPSPRANSFQEPFAFPQDTQRNTPNIRRTNQYLERIETPMKYSFPHITTK